MSAPKQKGKLREGEAVSKDTATIETPFSVTSVSSLVAFSFLQPKKVSGPKNFRCPQFAESSDFLPFSHLFIFLLCFKTFLFKEAPATKAK